MTLLIVLIGNLVFQEKNVLIQLMILQNFIEGLELNKLVKIHNFGTFKLKRKTKRIGRNPKTKEEFIISDRNVITFKASKHIISYINQNLDK